MARSKTLNGAGSFIASEQKGFRPNRAQNERKERTFHEGLTSWREWLVDLQRRLCRDLVSIALANRECLGSDPLTWVNECIDNYWATRRAGFKNWVVLCCDQAEPEGWYAPSWLLSQVPDDILRLHLQVAPLAETLDGRVSVPYTEVIRQQIASLIEMRLHLTRIEVLDDAKISIASEPTPKHATQSASSIVRINEAVYAIGRKYGNEWNTKWLESTAGLYAKLHLSQEEFAIDESSPTDKIEHKEIVLKGKRCDEIVQEIRRLRNMVVTHHRTMAEIRSQNPGFQVWALSEILSEADRETFNHPRQWGPPVGYALGLLAKDYLRSAHTVADWRKIYRQTRRKVTVKRGG